MARRQRIFGANIPEHPQPFSAALRIGNMIFTSAFGGQVAATGKSPDDPRQQIAQAFSNMKAIGLAVTPWRATCRATGSFRWNSLP